MNLEDKIAKLCIDKYNSLKNTGKPTEKEWTVLSGVVLEDCLGGFQVVSLSTGTKCLSGIELKSSDYLDRGNRLSDSHAEILARRSFLRYLYHQIVLLLDQQKSDIFNLDGGNIKLKNISFHFFSSQTPCGDCSIIPKIKESSEDCMIPPKKLKKDNFETDFGEEISDVYRTGAKCVENDIRQDPCEDGINYHSVGPLRTKPGRGDRTLSLSCSDKMAKWNIMGVQGALLSLMVPSIRFESIIIGGGCPYSFDSMQRGIFKRFDHNIKAPLIMQSGLIFEHRKVISRIRPCPSSIIWCAVPEKEIEIAVGGYRQGVTKKRIKSCSLLISRKEMFKTFLKVYDKFSHSKRHPSHPKKLTYCYCKDYSSSYRKLWKDTLRIIPTWPTKPLHLKDCLTF